MKKILLTVFTDNEKSYKEKLQFISKMYNEKYLGIFMKFNNAYGFKSLINTDDNTEEYKTPYDLLITSLNFLNQPKELMTIIVDDTEYVHPNKKYSYNTLDILLKFQNYLYYLFPKDIKVKIEIKKEYVLNVKQFALSYLFCCTAEGENVENEFSLPRYLKPKEKDYILNVMKQVISYEPIIYQYFCTTCYEYNKETPIHTEMNDKKRQEKAILDSINYGYYRPSLIKDFEKIRKETIKNINKKY